MFSVPHYKQCNGGKHLSSGAHGVEPSQYQGNVIVAVTIVIVILVCTGGAIIASIPAYDQCSCLFSHILTIGVLINEMLTICKIPYVCLQPAHQTDKYMYSVKHLTASHTFVRPAGQPDRPYSLWQLPYNTHVCLWSGISQVSSMQCSHPSQSEYSDTPTRAVSQHLRQWGS